jgi:hypothetical protein
MNLSLSLSLSHFFNTTHIIIAQARGSSLLTCYPIDTVKTHIQTLNPNPFRQDCMVVLVVVCLGKFRMLF